MEPRIIKTKAQHREALAEVERLTIDDPRLGTPEGDRLELLAKLVEDYEKQRFPFARPDALSAIRFRMEERGPLIGPLRRTVGGQSAEKRSCSHSPASYL